MKKYFWLLITLILLLWTSVFATYEDFFNQLENMWVSPQKIESENSISRYNVARLLNSVECKDCVIPNQNMINTYVQSFRSTFTAQEDKDFSDIQYLWGIYNNQSYYYCVAYVGDNNYMKGYPKATSPVCEWQFCGSKNMTTAEFIQVVVNIMSKYMYRDISVNRKDAYKRSSSIKTGSYQDNVLTKNDKKIIQEESEVCENSCTLQNKEEVSTYLKYCMFNLKQCSMEEVGKIKQWYRPVAEINLLHMQNIINKDDSTRRNTEKNIDGKTVLETLYKLNQTVSCVFNNDYDCDSLSNTQDNCPNHYNPKQTDTDKDGIGDVCDDDIDGDGIKNPIWIIDDNGNISISKRTKETDNCLFIINQDQADENNNYVGNSCENTEQNLGIYIDINKITWIAPLTTTLSAITDGETVEEILRDFGDGYQAKWSTTTHTFLAPWRYDIQATAKSKNSEAIAYMTIVVGGNKWDTTTLQTRTDLIGDKESIDSTLSITSLWSFDEIQRSFQKENEVIKKNNKDIIKKTFTSPWEHPILVKWYTNGKVTAISYFTIGIGEDGRWSLLRSNINNPEINQKILLDTNTYNINQSDIVMVDWDFGDEVKETNTTLTMEYSYTKAGKKVVSQTIHLTDGKQITNMITLYVIDTTNLASYALHMKPSTLIANKWEEITFNANIIGTLPTPATIQFLDLSDGTIQKSTENIPETFTHIYQKKWAETPQNKVHIDQCTSLTTQATIAIQWRDLCLEAKIQENLGEYKCDLDWDKIPDMCDDDIDNDGILNLIWIINNENKDCSYDFTNNINQEIAKKHYQGVCSLDNAPFGHNPDQLDLNLDGIGDVQTQTGIHNDDIVDSDNDSIPNSTDLCPNIKETRNGIEDEDGCPEIATELICNNLIYDDIVIKPMECNQCPCPFSDIANDLTNNDEIRAILRDKQKTIPYKFSYTWIVDFENM